MADLAARSRGRARAVGVDPDDARRAWSTEFERDARRGQAVPRRADVGVPRRQARARRRRRHGARAHARARAPDTLFVLFSATQGPGRPRDADALRAQEVPLRRAGLEVLARVRARDPREGGRDDPARDEPPRRLPARTALARRREVERPRGDPQGDGGGADALHAGRAQRLPRHELRPHAERADHAHRRPRLGAFLREEVFEPLGLRDLYLGLPDDAGARGARGVVLQRDQPVAGQGRRARDGRGLGRARAEQTSAATAGAVAEAPTTRGSSIGASRRLVMRTSPRCGTSSTGRRSHRAVLPAAGGIGTARELAALYVGALAGRRARRAGAGLARRSRLRDDADQSRQATWTA